MSTARWFILIAIVSIIAFIILAGSNPFSFGDAYFRPRASINPFPSPSQESLPASETSDNNISPDVTVGEGITIDR